MKKNKIANFKQLDGSLKLTKKKSKNVESSTKKKPKFNIKFID